MRFARGLGLSVVTPAIGGQFVQGNVERCIERANCYGQQRFCRKNKGGFFSGAIGAGSDQCLQAGASRYGLPVGGEGTGWQLADADDGERGFLVQYSLHQARGFLLQSLNGGWRGLRAGESDLD